MWAGLLSSLFSALVVVAAVLVLVFGAVVFSAFAMERILLFAVGVEGEFWFWTGSGEISSSPSPLERLLLLLLLLSVVALLLLIVLVLELLLLSGCFLSNPIPKSRVLKRGLVPSLPGLGGSGEAGLFHIWIVTKLNKTKPKLS